MKKRFAKTLAGGLLGAAALLAPLILAQAPKGEQSTKPADVAFVNVAPMDRERVLENQTVIIRDGRIANGMKSLWGAPFFKDALGPGLRRGHCLVYDEQRRQVSLLSGYQPPNQPKIKSSD